MVLPDFHALLYPWLKIAFASVFISFIHKNLLCFPLEKCEMHLFNLKKNTGGPWLARISLVRISLAGIFKYTPFLGKHVLRISLARSFTKELVHNFTSTNLACTSFSVAQNSCKPRTPCNLLCHLQLDFL